MFAAIAAIVAISATIGYNNQADKSTHSNLAIANIEALTYDEWGFDGGCVSNGDGCMPGLNRWYPDLLPKDM